MNQHLFNTFQHLSRKGVDALLPLNAGVTEMTTPYTPFKESLHTRGRAHTRLYEKARAGKGVKRCQGVERAEIAFTDNGHDPHGRPFAIRLRQLLTLARSMGMMASWTPSDAPESSSGPAMTAVDEEQR